jgi:hypothetical protein
MKLHFEYNKEQDIKCIMRVSSAGQDYAQKPTALYAEFLAYSQEIHQQKWSMHGIYKPVRKEMLQQST